MSLLSLKLTNSWLKTPETFYQHVEPSPLQDPSFVHFNHELANTLGLAIEDDYTNMLQCFSGDKLLPEMKPVATVYAGHQFGIFTSKLGDGRALLLGELHTENDKKYDLQLKGSGLTPFSRTMDGRYALSVAIREYLASKALSGLGIKTTQALCLLSSETRLKGDENERAAILVRVASSHIRFGHFEYFYHRDDLIGLQQMFNYVVEQHFPELLSELAENRPLLFLKTVVTRTAKLIADWQSIGFTHGVINTDNMTLSGETIDLGPFGFMETFDPAFTPNTSDEEHRYQFDQQADIGRWNCLALAQALSPLLKTSLIPAGLFRLYRQSYEQYYLANMRAKLGLKLELDGDSELIKSLCSVMLMTKADYSHFFRDLAQYQLDPSNISLFTGLSKYSVLAKWLESYQQRLGIETTTAEDRLQQMNSVNPCYLLRESIIKSVVLNAQKGDFSKLDKVMVSLAKPYEDVADDYRATQARSDAG